MNDDVVFVAASHIDSHFYLYVIRTVVVHCGNTILIHCEHVLRQILHWVDIAVDERVLSGGDGRSAVILDGVLRLRLRAADVDLVLRKSEQPLSRSRYQYRVVLSVEM